MGEVRDENYITEMIFIPFYNHSVTFRKCVSAKKGCPKEMDSLFYIE